MATLKVPSVHASIKAAIAAATSGDTIEVAAGTYTEVGQIVIDKNLTIVGAGKTVTIVKPDADTGSAGDPKGWWLVSPGIVFNLSKVTLDGTGKMIHQGIRHKGTGTIQHVHLTGLSYGPPSAYTGQAICAFGGVGAVDVSDCAFDNIGRVGILYYGVGSTGTYARNHFTGKGAGDHLDYGVEIGAGAVAAITGSTFTGCLGEASFDGSDSAGVAVLTYYGPGTAGEITGNTFTGNRLGIGVGWDGTDTSVVHAHGNNITGNVMGGVEATGLTATVDATDNWWGDISGPGTVGPGSGDMVSANVLYAPFAVRPFTRTLEVDPVSRIEGHLGVKVTTNLDGTITEADAHGNLFRGFENFLIGRKVNDAITFTQRICGVCPVPHGTAATFAADSVLGVSSGYATFSSDQSGYSTDGVPAAALHVRNMVLAAEFLMSSITHFYHLAAQSYVQGPPVPPWTPYFADEQYHPALRSAGKVLPTQNAGSKDDAEHIALNTGTLGNGWNAGYSSDLWSAVITQYVKALRIRRLALEAGALFAGRMPMMSNAVAGGTTNNFRTRAEFDAKLQTFRKLIEEVGTFVVREYIPLALALGALYPDFDNANNTGGKGWGGGLGNFLAWGGFPQADGTMALKGGVVVDAAGSADTTRLLENRAGSGAGSLADAKSKVEANLKEFITRSRYANAHGYEAGDSAYPGNVTMTEPERDTAAKYSWLKAPRWDGYAMEVGPLARMVVNAKYPVHGESIVFSGYEGVYTTAVSGANLNGVDLRVLDRDLVSGLVGLGLPTASAVTAYIAGASGGLSTIDRLRARAIESFWMVAYLIGAPAKNNTTGAISFPAWNAGSGNGWVGELQRLGGGTTVPPFFRTTGPPPGTVSGYGLVEAPRGALGHFVKAYAGKIISYQCVVPTTWNASPKDGSTAPVAPNEKVGTHRGAMEQSMMDVVFDASPMDGSVLSSDGRMSGVEVLRVAQSFDPCIACAVH